MQAARDEMQWAEEGPPPMVVKIAPDLSKEDLEDIAAVRSLMTILHLHLLQVFLCFHIYQFLGCPCSAR